MFTTHCLCLLCKTGSSPTNTRCTQWTEEYGCTAGREQENEGEEIVIEICNSSKLTVLCWLIWRNKWYAIFKRPSALSFVHPAGGGIIGGYSGPAAERSSLLYYFVKRKRYISSRPPFKNILELFGALFNKTRLRRSWQGGMWEARADLRGLSHPPHYPRGHFSSDHGLRRGPRPPSSDREA